MPYDAKAIANYLLDMAEAAGQALTPMKLQKLVYFAHGWHLGLTGEPLLDEQVQAWSFGPVVRSLYDAFREFGADPIPRKALIFEPLGGLKVRVKAPSLAESVSVDKDLAELFLTRIWEVYGGYSASQLSNMTHAPGTPWDRVSKHYGGNIPKHTTIPQEWIREYFQPQEKSA